MIIMSFESVLKANKIRDCLYDTVKKQGKVSVYEYWKLCDVPINLNESLKHFVWSLNDILNSKIVETNCGFFEIHLPRPKGIKGIYMNEGGYDN